MKINSLSRLMLAGVLLVSFNASAVSGLWQQGYGQGNAEYSVTDSSGKMFTINCTENPDQNGIYQQSVFLTLAGDKTISSHDDSTDITVVMGPISNTPFPQPLAGVTGIMPGLVSSWISVRPGSSTSTSMTAKRALSALTRRTPRRSCPLPESVVTTDTRIFSHKPTPTTSWLPGFSFTHSLKCPDRYYLHYKNEL